ncbi:cell division protein FtsA [Pelosinus sp. sgz500959]|uniref:cell division protein FtsA n=1 Tax=Pelosinus sp. sgz500959 TaxID=3242472 RepID=UPI003671F7C9
MDNRYILGIDIGTSTIKAFIGNKMKDGTVFVAGNGTMPTVGIAKGTITDVEQLAMAISQAVECAVMATHISVKDAYIGIGGVELSSISGIGSISLSTTDVIIHDDIERVYQAAILASIPDDHEVLHILPKSFLVDKQRQTHLPLQQQCSHLEVEAQIVSMPRESVYKLIDTVERLGIHIVGVVANHIVASQVLSNISTENYVFMDIGAGTTELMVVRDGQVHLSAALALGGHYITSDIMNGFEITYQHAEEIKRYYSKLDKNLRGKNIILDCNGYGTIDKQFSYDFLYDIIESRIEEIVYLIHEHLKSTMELSKFDKILLTGGCSAMLDIRDHIQKLFGIPVEEVNLEELLPEYANHTNLACYGVLTYAVNHIPDAPVASSHNAWRTLVSKFKNLLTS